MYCLKNAFSAFCLFLVFSSSSFAASINWKSWNEDNFNLAKEQNKLIFLDVGTEWCSACNQMQHETYTDEQIQNFINENFIAIHVDAEAEPDIGERYGFWGWPALIFISPQGDHVGFYRGFRPVADFLPILSLLNSNHQNGILEVPDIDVDLTSMSSNNDFIDIVSLGNEMIDRFYDTQNNSWGGARMADSYLFSQAHWRGQSQGQQLWSKRALASSEQYLKMLDPVWGGIWFGTRSADFSGDFVYEKRTEHQSGALNIFAQAYRMDQQKKWLNAIDAIVDYIDTFMRAEKGGYYTSQEMHVLTSDVEISPESYFNLNDQQRRAHGIPSIDKTQYTDINAKLVIAFSHLYETTGDPQWRERAVSLMNHLKLSANQNGHYKQIITVDGHTERARKLPPKNDSIVFLRTQAFAGLASLALFQISGDQQWLTHAHHVAQVLIDALHDKNGGGLYGSNRDAFGPGGKKLVDQPLIDTGAAADFFNRLSAYTYGAYENIGEYDSKQYHDFSETALRAVAQPHRLRVQGNFIGQYVFALHAWNDEFAQVSVVCPDIDHPQCKQLHKTALVELSHPRRIVKVQNPGYYPDRGVASLFICNSSTCSSPISHTDSDLLNKANRWFSILGGNTSLNNQAIRKVKLSDIEK